MPSLHELSRFYERSKIDCPLVLMTRVREPLDYYLSFYRWGVAFRQKEDPASFGKDFIEWAERVPDLQSTMMMQSMAAMAAEYHVNQYKRERRRRPLFFRPPRLTPLPLFRRAELRCARLSQRTTREARRSAGRRRRRGRSSPASSTASRSWAR